MSITERLPSTHRAVHHPNVARTAVLLAVGGSASQKFVAPQLVLPGARRGTSTGSRCCPILALEARTTNDVDDPAAVGAPAVFGCRGPVLVEAGTAQHRPAFVAGAHGRGGSTDEGGFALRALGSDWGGVGW